MIKLALDTSFENLSICITKNNSILVNFYSSSKRKNSKIIFTIIDDLLKNTGLKLEEIDLYIVNCGPGSYTGVRIGMAVIKTFAQVYKKPVIPVNSLELIAGQIKNENKFNVLLNCTKREVYHANFKIVNNFPVLDSRIFLSNLENFLKESNNFPFILHRVNPEKRAPEPMFDKLDKIKPDIPLPDAKLLETIGTEKFKKSSFDFKSQINPLYIKREI
tara:strand:+ start:183 stop:836 length:654 start_codon:yes stop_codon:yes gene_type:complete